MLEVNKVLVPNSEEGGRQGCTRLREGWNETRPFLALFWLEFGQYFGSISPTRQNRKLVW